MNCPSCGEEFNSLGKHLAFANCQPQLSNYQHEILRGVLMSDGWLGSSNRCIQAEWKNEEYTKFVNEELGWVCSSVKQRKYRDSIWQLCTISLDYIENNFNWYSEGQKRWPLSEPMTDTALAHLYAGDGHLKERDKREPAVVICCDNEADRLYKIAEWINNSGYPKPTPHVSENSSRLYFGTEETYEMLNSIEPIVGYEYKWGKYGN